MGGERYVVQVCCKCHLVSLVCRKDWRSRNFKSTPDTTCDIGQLNVSFGRHVPCHWRHRATGTGGQEFSVYCSLLGKGCSKSFCSDLQTFHKGHSWGLSWIMMNMEYRRVYQQCHFGGPFSKKFTTDLWKSLTYEKRRMSMWFSKNLTKILCKT